MSFQLLHEFQQNNQVYICKAFQMHQLTVAEHNLGPKYRFAELNLGSSIFLNLGLMEF